MPTIEQTIKKIENFATLQKGWHFGEGNSISQDRIALVVYFLKQAEEWNIIRSNAFPGIGGEVEVTLHYKDATITFTWETDGTITVVEDENGEIVLDIEGLNYNDAERELWKFAQKIQTTSESFTWDTGTLKTKDFLVEPFRSHLTKGSQLLKRDVLYRLAKLSASTSRRSTIKLLASRTYSGISQEEKLQTLRLPKKTAIPEISVTTTLEELAATNATSSLENIQVRRRTS